MSAMAPPLTDEVDQLLAFLSQQRRALHIAAYGLSDAQSRLSPTPSSLSVSGLIKHVTSVEEFWIKLAGGLPTGQADYENGFRLIGDETLAGALARLDEVGNVTEEFVRRVSDLDLEVPVPKDVPWFPKDIDAWTLRWVLLHLIEEVARHAGHADIIREAIDGATMHPLMAAVEGWPETEWLKPWRPAA
jgi:uncharacterized damage-inducible protein DinB